MLAFDARVASLTYSAASRPLPACLGLGSLPANQKPAPQAEFLWKHPLGLQPRKLRLLFRHLRLLLVPGPCADALGQGIVLLLLVRSGLARRLALPNQQSWDAARFRKQWPGQSPAPV